MLFTAPHGLRLIKGKGPKTCPQSRASAGHGDRLKLAGSGVWEREKAGGRCGRGTGANARLVHGVDAMGANTFDAGNLDPNYVDRDGATLSAAQRFAFGLWVDVPGCGAQVGGIAPVWCTSTSMEDGPRRQPRCGRRAAADGGGGARRRRAPQELCRAANGGGGRGALPRLSQEQAAAAAHH